MRHPSCDAGARLPRRWLIGQLPPSSGRSLLVLPVSLPGHRQLFSFPLLPLFGATAAAIHAAERQRTVLPVRPGCWHR
jgi:hypothetical protein